MRSILAILLVLVVCGICFAKTCRESSECPNGSFCLYPAGMCHGEGHCAFVPSACSTEITYVCGCDGRTYPNACFAFSRNVSIFEDEGCNDVQLCSSNKDCSNNGRPQYCQLPNGQCEGRGRCADMPDWCDSNKHEVCGCDGITYQNDCNAAQAGVNVVSRSHCKNLPCNQNSDCTQPNTYCSKPMGNCNAVGECIGRPLTCTQEFDPVCGCDGRYYGNACYASTDGTSVLNEGSCKSK